MKLHIYAFMRIKTIFCFKNVSYLTNIWLESRNTPCHIYKSTFAASQTKRSHRQVICLMTRVPIVANCPGVLEATIFLQVGRKLLYLWRCLPTKVYSLCALSGFLSQRESRASMRSNVREGNFDLYMILQRQRVIL